MRSMSPGTRPMGPGAAGTGRPFWARLAGAPCRCPKPPSGFICAFRCGPVPGQRRDGRREDFAWRPPVPGVPNSGRDVLAAHQDRQGPFSHPGSKPWVLGSVRTRNPEPRTQNPEPTRTHQNPPEPTRTHQNPPEPTTRMQHSQVHHDKMQHSIMQHSKM